MGFQFAEFQMEGTLSSAVEEKVESFEQKANRLRLEGNDLLRADCVEQAVERYTQSLEARIDGLTLSNRAQAYLKLGRLERLNLNLFKYISFGKC